MSGTCWPGLVAHSDTDIPGQTQRSIPTDKILIYNISRAIVCSSRRKSAREPQLQRFIVDTEAEMVHENQCWISRKPCRIPCWIPHFKGVENDCDVLLPSRESTLNDRCNSNKHQMKLFLTTIKELCPAQRGWWILKTQTVSGRKKGLVAGELWGNELKRASKKRSPGKRIKQR